MGWKEGKEEKGWRKGGEEFSTLFYSLPKLGGRRGVVVTRLIQSAKLLYTGPG